MFDLLCNNVHSTTIRLAEVVKHLKKIKFQGFPIMLEGEESETVRSRNISLAREKTLRQILFSVKEFSREDGLVFFFRSKRSQSKLTKLAIFLLNKFLKYLVISSIICLCDSVRMPLIIKEEMVFS